MVKFAMVYMCLVGILVGAENQRLQSVATRTFKFDEKHSGGVKGNIMVTYMYEKSKYFGALISAKINLKNADWHALRKADGNCTGQIEEFKWHIHTKWDNKRTSGLLDQCSFAKTANHYDPDFACGPNSDHVKEDKCKSITPQYNCKPDIFMNNPSKCEKGDLSGKLGGMVNKGGRIRGKWFDPHYPRLDESEASWNIVLHAVCGKNTPRFVCAVTDQ